MEKKYTNGEVTVHWKPGLCIHSGICAMGLPGVFRPKDRPWVQIENGTTAEIIATVKKCPSGALSYSFNEESTHTPSVNKELLVIELMNKGPLLIKEPCILKMEDGSERKLEKGGAICRCGQSSNKPFCDGTHKRLA